MPRPAGSSDRADVSAAARAPGLTAAPESPPAQIPAERLLKAEELVDAAVWGTDLGLWEDSVDGGYNWFDRWYERFDIEPCVGADAYQQWCARVHPDDLESYLHAEDVCLHRGVDSYSADYRIRTRSGRWRWVHERGRVVARTREGVPTRYVGVCVDFDQQKATEAALRASEERFRSAFEFAAIGMALVAPDGRFLRVNQSLCRIVGYSAEELLRTDFQTITHPDDLGTDLAYMGKMLDGSLSYYEMEKRYFHKTGRTIWILLSVSLIRGADGQPQYFISQIQDITGRKQAEERLRQSELRHRTTSDLVPGFVFEGAVADGVPYLMWVSDGFERVCGCSLAEFKRLGAEHFLDAETRAQLWSGAARVARGEDLSLDLRLRATDGTQKWLRVVARAITADGARVLGVAEDITEQNRLARALREATQHEQRRLGQEIHDGLGQELTGLAYLAGSLAKAAADSGSPPGNDLATLEGIANQAVRTCRSIARGVSPLTESRGSLAQALRGLVESVAAGGRMSIGFEAIENAPLTLPWAHRDHLYRIAQEAVTNALRHSAGDRLELRLEIESTGVRLEVADNGRGLDPQRGASDGLGMDSMRQRAAAIGARLHLETPAAGGTAVVCECPQASPTTAGSVSTAPAEA